MTTKEEAPREKFLELVDSVMGALRENKELLPEDVLDELTLIFYEVLNTQADKVDWHEKLETTKKVLRRNYNILPAELQEKV